MTKETKEKKECVFCKITKGEWQVDKLYEDDNFIVFNDKFPVAPGHCLIVPTKHYATILDMPSSLGTELVDLAKKQGLRLIKEKKADGFKLVQNNFAAAGQAVMHFHLHVVPEKEGVKREKYI